MELGKFRNLLEPDNIRLVPLAAYGIARGLAKMAIYELTHRDKPQETQPASIQYYSTGEQDGE